MAVNFENVFPLQMSCIIRSFSYSYRIFLSLLAIFANCISTLYFSFLLRIYFAIRTIFEILFQAAHSVSYNIIESEVRVTMPLGYIPLGYIMPLGYMP